MNHLQDVKKDSVAPNVNLAILRDLRFHHCKEFWRLIMFRPALFHHLLHVVGCHSEVG